MPEDPAIRPAAGTVGWRWMGSGEPLFLRVADQIERYVKGNGLSPGDRLPGERDLCELLGVSRASVREALRSLQTRGVVSVRHGKGVFVASPAEAERAMQRFARLREVGMEELFAMREVLEVPAAGWAATAATDEQLQHLVVTFERLERAVLAGSSPGELQAMDALLHLQIAEYASNRFLAMTQTVLQEMLARSMDTTLAIAGRPARSITEHAGIIEALLARDASRARTAARRHLPSARRAALRRVASERAQAAPLLTPGPADRQTPPPGRRR
jgi:GntR family transcriptional regulator, transcriptional repressor for pyruvate dehydrogenase complex